MSKKSTLNRAVSPRRGLSFPNLALTDRMIGEYMQAPRKISGPIEPAYKSATDRATEAFEKNGGILSTDQAIRLGIHPRTLYALRDNAKLERMERGLYRLADAKPLGIESIPKDDLEPKLKHASQPTQKGEYHKVKHGFDLLALIDPEKVGLASPHARRFNDFLRGL